jgi:DNA-binding beta-propeller fold protein YncE
VEDAVGLDGTVYVVDEFSAEVTPVDPLTNEMEPPIDLPVGTDPYSIATVPSGVLGASELLVGNIGDIQGGSAGLWAINPETDAVIPLADLTNENPASTEEVPLSDDNVVAIGVEPTGVLDGTPGEIYALTTSSSLPAPGVVVAFNPMTDTQTDITVGPGADALTVDPNTGLVYVANSDGDSISEIEPSTNAVSTFTLFPLAPPAGTAAQLEVPDGIAYNPSNDDIEVEVGVEDTMTNGTGTHYTEVEQFDPGTSHWTGFDDINGSGSLDGIAVSNYGVYSGDVFVAGTSGGDGALFIGNTTTGSVATISLGDATPYGVAIGDINDGEGGDAYVTNLLSDPGTLLIINPAADDD